MAVKAFALISWSIAVSLLSTGSVVPISLAQAASASSAPTCRNIQLNTRVQTSQGAAGHIAIIFRLHNLSSQTCALFGYPGVKLLDHHFSTQPTTVHRNPGNLVGALQKHAVRLVPGENAYFALGYSDVPVNSRPCLTAYYLMIFPPNNLLPVVTYAPRGGITACTGNINVSPVTAHPRFQ